MDFDWPKYFNLSNKNVFLNKTPKNYFYPILNDKHLFQIESKLFTKKIKNAEITNENYETNETCQICNQKRPKRVSLNIVKVVLKKYKNQFYFLLIVCHHIQFWKKVINTRCPKKNFT